MENTQQIAIIGLHGRFPKSKTGESYWNNLANGNVLTDKIPTERWGKNNTSIKNNEGKFIRELYGGFLSDIDEFDFNLFGLQEETAKTMDPRQRLFLESVWTTLEDGGYGAHRQTSRDIIGLFCGIMSNDYSLISYDYGLLDDIKKNYNSFSFDIANRISFLLNLKGPSMVIESACSSSLAAIHLACNSLKAGECDMAIAGGVNLIMHPSRYIFLVQTGMLAQTKEKKLFKPDSEGYIPGEGVGSVLLKPLAKAIEDNDHIYGVIRGSHMNHNGSGIFYRNPDANRQTTLLLDTFEKAGIEPESISHIEMHAYGSEMNDLSELKGLKDSFKQGSKQGSDQTRYCSLGSVKPNIGHLEAASGISQLIKVLYQLKYQKIAPLEFDPQLLDSLQLEDTPFYVAKTLEDWQPSHPHNSDIPRRAGISSFGAGGVNVHLVLEEFFVQNKKSIQVDIVQASELPIILSAMETELLKQQAKNLLQAIDQEIGNPLFSLPNIKRSLLTGREMMSHRLAIIANSIEQLREGLQKFIDNKPDDAIIQGIVVENEIVENEIDLSSLSSRELAKKWVRGRFLDWHQLSSFSDLQKIPLPTYPFSRNSCWISPQGTSPCDKIPDVAMAKESRLSLDRILEEKLTSYFRKIIAEEIKVSPEQVYGTRNFSEFGLSSLNIKRMNLSINADFKNIPKTIFFEYQTIQKLVSYFINSHHDDVLKFLNPDFESETDGNIQKPALRPSSEEKTLYQKVEVNNTDQDEDIAIIAVSGRYPGAESCEVFWDNIKNGKDCIGEIPLNRWDNSKFYNGDRNKPGSVYSKWGGFIEDVGSFDPFVFEISPLEAMTMDPQERVFMQCVWELLENAGYAPFEFRRATNKEITKIGVFAGVMWGHYQLSGMEAAKASNRLLPNSDFWTVANRISYTFNFTGPSMAIDTACSSSLVAVHLACESIKRGECVSAIAGGVSLTLHPQKYIYECQKQFISPTGRCRSFGEGADGFVTGEGVGCVMLKPITKAVEDGDRIHAIIKGSHVNHDGKTNGYTVPNPGSQADLILGALGKAKVDPVTISYIEAHGTGTDLGDPIEIEGIKRAFKEKQHKMNDCSIGSVKSNIGHLEAAAGIAGLTKILFQMRDKKLAPSLHSARMNPNISLAGTPFKVQQQLEDWKRSVPRRAGISSFGAGGTNAHVILEEYQAGSEIKRCDSQNVQVIIVSAFNEKTLLDYLKKIGSFLADNYQADIVESKDRIYLAEVAYTLQVAREPMKERVAFIVDGIQDLSNKIEEFLIRKSSFQDVYRGNTSHEREVVQLLLDGIEGDNFIAEIVQQKNLSKLAKLWVSGVTINWKMLHTQLQPRIISLPNYPFANEQYWITEELKNENEIFKNHIVENSIHPLINRNISTLRCQRYLTCLRGDEYFLQDHVIGNKKVIPGAVYLEIVRAACQLAAEMGVEKISDVSWIKPIMVRTSAINVYTNLNLNENDIDFTITADTSDSIENLDDTIRVESEDTIYLSGKLQFLRGDSQVDESGNNKAIAIDLIKEKCGNYLGKSRFYELCAISGLNYGTTFQTIQELCFNENEVLSKLSLDSKFMHDSGDYVLHPSLLDGAFQSVLVLLNGDTEIAYRESTYLPVSIKELEIKESLPSTCYAYIHYLGENRAQTQFDIFICNMQGKVLTKILQFTLINTKAGILNEITANTSDVECLKFTPSWKILNNISDADIDLKKGTSIIIDADESLFTKLHDSPRNQGKYRLIKPGNKTIQFSESTYTIDLTATDSYRKVFRLEKKQKFELSKIIINLTPLLSNYKQDNGSRFTHGFFILFHLIKELIQAYPGESFQCFCLLRTRKTGDISMYPMVSGFFRSLIQENPRFDYKLIEWIDDTQASDGSKYENRDFVEQILKEIAANTKYPKEIRYENDKRCTKVFREKTKKDSPIKIQPEGTYLIVGGLGGLGLIFANYLAKEYRANLVLYGRSELDSQKKQQIEKLSSLGGEVTYIQGDITKKQDIDYLVKTCKSSFSGINGIIFSAANLRDSLLIKKDAGEAQVVLTPKITGVSYLDESFKNEAMDFFVLFSSTASVIGNLGQCDYAYANGFLDSFAEFRNQLKEEGQRIGQTISINWPLWKDGGMRVSAETEKLLARSIGMTPMKTEAGIRAFIESVGESSSQLMVIEGYQEKLRRLFDVRNGYVQRLTGESQNVSSEEEEADHKGELKEIQENLTGIVTQLLKIRREDIDLSSDINEFGFDSIGLTEFSNQISNKFNIEVTPTIFFNLEYPSIQCISNYLYENFGSHFKKPKKEGAPADYQKASIPKETDSQVANRFSQASLVLKKAPKTPVVKPDHSVAVIGMAGIFPKSKSLEDFWQHLLDGHDLINEIPHSRREHGWEDLGPDETYLKYGGFLNEIDTFDPHFFSISPKEAELMDPQQRLFLEVTWNAIEDAGYRASSLSHSKTSVFAGVSTLDYLDILHQHNAESEAYTPTGTMHSILCNRISFLLNLHGPSESIDTACSSSLVAVLRGIESIRNGSCDLAIAGGVNAIITPGWSRALGQAGMLSKNSRCQTFSGAADGYVRSEGAGVIILKSLNKARLDGDQIHGIIKGGAINHGGRANSLTAPNAQAQADLLAAAYDDAGVEPSTIGYIEAHGTGTPLGDPIEIEGLKLGFERYNQKHGLSKVQESFCGLGSIKTNIGHCETAAGIAGIIKVLLALKNKTTPGIVHFRALNSFIDLKQSPFYIVKKSSSWEAMINQSGNEIPRRAGISSFGFGGVNAHVVLEENAANQQKSENNTINGKKLVPISAKSVKALQDYARKMIPFLEKTDESLENIAYTLQVGREPMNERIALIVSDKRELKDALDKFIKNEDKINGFYRGQIKPGESESKLLIEGNEGKEFLAIIIKEGKLNKLANLWTMGVDIDWRMIYPGQLPFRVSLPTYPFQKKRFWVNSRSYSENSITSPIERISSRPFLFSEVPSKEGLNYLIRVTGLEYYLEDHVVNQQKILPGTVYLEMAHEVGRLVNNSCIAKIKDVFWMQPIVVEREPRTIIFSVNPDNQNKSFKVVTNDKNNAEIIHAKGKFIYESNDHFVPTRDNERLDIESVKSRCPNVIDTQDCYNTFQKMGFQYGPRFKAIQHLQCGQTEAISKLTLPKELLTDFHLHTLHPVLLDGALQTSIGLIEDSELNSANTYLPFSINKIEIENSLVETCYVYVESVSDIETSLKGFKIFDISMVDETGRILVKITGFSLRIAMQSIPTAKSELSFLGYKWVNQELIGTIQQSTIPDSIVLFDSNDRLFDTLLARFESYEGAKPKIALIQFSGSFLEEANNRFQIDPGRKSDYERLLNCLASSGFDYSNIIYNWSSSIDNYSHEDLNSRCVNSGLYSVVSLVQSIAKRKIQKRVTLLGVYPGRNSTNELITRAFPYFAALGALFKTIHLEYPKLDFKCIEIDKVIQNKHVDHLLLEFGSDNREIKYEKGHRYTKTLIEFQRQKVKKDRVPIIIRKNGVYLITGGAGGLGLIFAEYLGRQHNARLILVGRSELDDRKREEIDRLSAKAEIMDYFKADVSSESEVKQLIRKAKDRFGKIDGVIHSAGVVNDSLLIDKSKEEISLQLHPKVSGTLLIDEATKGEKLDFFILFSSLSSVLGNIGQADYAYANSFMDHFVQVREEERKKGNRFGPSISINWPLWQSGGMEVDQIVEDRMKSKFGLIPLEEKLGISAFERILSLDENQVIVVSGDSRQLMNSQIQRHRFFENTSENTGKETCSSPLKPQQKKDINTRIQQELMKICSGCLKVKEDELEPDEELKDYGLDSIMMMSILTKIEETFNRSIDANLLVDYQSIRKIAEYMAAEGFELFGDSLESSPELYQIEENISQASADTEAFGKPADQFTSGATPRLNSIDRSSNKVAVIGMACRFPGSVDSDGFWEDLKNGTDLISQVPPERWDIAHHYSADKREKNKSYAKWGGFINDIELFDAEFFSISDRVAMLMDPQQRLLLELSQDLFDHAGYSKDAIDGWNVSIFLGGTTSNYLKNKSHLIPHDIKKHIIVSSIQNMMAARISNFFNLKGASQITDTACSSSLVALHQACNSILNGESEMAISGGVELLLDQDPFIQFSDAKVLSDDSRCHVFDKRAKGIVLGEGIGLVLLKSFDEAVKDGDQIYAVIRGSAINNDGSTIGLTVPSKEGQKDVIEQTIDIARVLPTDITLLEAHGTGTLLGDPIEIKAATEAFRSRTSANQFCYVGSVKSNFGHLLRAAGIASVIKVILAMGNKMIPPTLHCENPHPRFRFDQSPFKPVSSLTPWFSNGKRRMAAISSFGFGGTNCHMIIEEYPGDHKAMHAIKRIRLPKTRFRKKRYWLDENTQYLNDRSDFDIEEYRKVLMGLSEKSINPEQSLDLVGI